MPFPATPENSTADIEDESNEPGGDYPAEDAAEGEPATPPVSLTIAQASEAGITGANPGDTYTIKITVTDASEAITADIIPGSAIAEGSGPKPPQFGPRPKQSTKTPSDMGMAGEEGFSGMADNMP